MYRVLTCLSTQHDHRLLTLAIVVCVLESFVALYVYQQVSATHGYLGKGWLGVVGLCTGGAIWATHFIAMLAYEDGVPTAYGPVLTVVSLLVAIGVTTFGFSLSSCGRGQRARASGGAIIGLGIAVMHMIGMKALIIAGTIEWDYTLLAAAVVVGPILMAGAMLSLRKLEGLGGLLTATACLALGILGMHLTAMAAVTIVPDPTIVVPDLSISNSTLALAIVTTTVLVLASGLIASFQDSQAFREARSTRELVDAATDALVLAHDGIIVDTNGRTAEMLGGSDIDLRGRRVFGDLLAAEPVGAGMCTFEAELIAADGTRIPVEVLRQSLEYSASDANEVYAINDLRPLIRTTDRLTRMNEELQVREEQLRTQNVRFDTALSHMTQGLCMFDAEQRIVVCNRRYAELYGLTLEQLPRGTRLDEIVDMRIANGLYAGESPDAYRQERRRSIAHDLDMVQELNDGRFIAISLRLMPDGGYVSTHEDVTERRRMEDQLIHMAHHDPLTDLPNRLLLRRRLEKALKGSRRSDAQLAVLMLDLDRFKEVNDTLGHMVGDALIKAVAQKLRQGMRRKAMVARFGGDEFSIVDHLHPDDDPEALPKRVQELINEPIELDGHWVSVGATIGIAIAPRDGDDPDELLMRADHALYRAKSEARGTYRFFEAQMGAALQERRSLEHDLHEALLAGQLEMHYQPLVNLEHGRIAGFEFLMRWNHPTRGSIPPTLFIPLAEETGLITTLTEWALQEACEEASRWPSDLSVAVNLSVPQFKARNLLPTLAAVLARTGLAPERLELEITETVMLNDAEGVFAIFRQLHELGVRIVLDDFGTGFSSLSYLLRFPFDKIKIDRSFIHGLAQGGNSLVLVRSLIQMARGLGVRVTAEGIETQEQLDIVRAEGCTDAQGYYLSLPKPASEIRDLRHRPLRPLKAQEIAVA